MLGYAVNMWMIRFVQLCSSTYEHTATGKVFEDYVTTTVTNVIASFFNSPFSEQSSTTEVDNAHMFSILLK